MLFCCFTSHSIRFIHFETVHLKKKKKIDYPNYIYEPKSDALKILIWRGVIVETLAGTQFWTAHRLHIT